MSKKEKLLNCLYHAQESLEADFSEYIKWVEEAIFDIPTQEEIDDSKMWYDNESYQIGFEEGCNYILNYKPDCA